MTTIQPAVSNDDGEQFDLIHRYTRAQAIADGELVDVTTTAREAGLKLPVAMTRALWGTCVSLTPIAIEMGCDEAGRLWDVLWMLYLAIRSGRIQEDMGTFELLVVTTRRQPTLTTVKAVCGPGDEAEPVITLMLPGED